MVLLLRTTGAKTCSSITRRSRRRASGRSPRVMPWSSRSSRDRRHRPPPTSARSDPNAPIASLRAAYDGRPASFQGPIEEFHEARLHGAPVVLSPRQVPLIGKNQEVVALLRRVEGVHQPRRVPEMDVLVDHSVHNEESPVETGGQGQEGALAVALQVLL